MADGLYALQSPVAATDTSLPLLLRDPLLAAPNNGIRFLMDAGFGFSYPGGPFVGRPAAAAPLNSTNVYDVAELSNASWVIPGGQTMLYSGGGFDFTNVNVKGVYAQIPASVAADIWNAFGGASQRFFMCCYLKLPLLADWPQTGGINGFMSFAASNAGTGLPDIATFGMVNSGQVQAVRQYTGGSLQGTGFTPSASAYGTLCQMAAWRTQANGLSMSLRSVAGGIQSSTNASTNTDNVENFSTRTGQVGIGTAYWPNTLNAGSNSAGAMKFRIYRAFVENLARSGRDPVTVLDADWTRVQARITANAAANGGTSTIFN